jgi:phosphate acetyltransferase
MKAARIVFPEGEDERILKAASVIAKRGIAKVILLGDIDTILKKIEKLRLKFNVSTKKSNKDFRAPKNAYPRHCIFSVINPETATEREIYKQKLYELRRKKGMSVLEARKLINDANYFACMMLYMDDCDAVLSGAVYSTPEMLRPAFQIIKTKKGIKKASGAILLKVKGKDYLFADCSVQENPSADELAEIAQLSSKTFQTITGKKARIAMLSYHTRSSKGKVSEYFRKVRKAAAIAKRKGLDVEGEIQLDAAIEKKTALRKHIRFIDANVLIFPNLDAGNIGYKLVKIFADAKMTGVIIQGLRKPVNDLSRGCSVEDIVNLAAVTAKQKF